MLCSFGVFRAQPELCFVFQRGDFKVCFRRNRRWLKVVFSRWAVYSNSIDQAYFTPLRTAWELVRNLVAHGGAREGKWRGNWRMESVASTLTPPPNVVYPALLKLMRTPRLPAVDWTDAPNDLNGLVSFGERRNLVSARVPSRSAQAIQHWFTSLRSARSTALVHTTAHHNFTTLFHTFPDVQER